VYLDKLSKLHHYDLLIRFCGPESASQSFWWDFQCTFLKIKNVEQNKKTLKNVKNVFYIYG